MEVLKARHTRLCLRAAALGLLLAGGAVNAVTLEEYQVKALFVFNFTHFVDWPARVFPEAGSPFSICVVGENPFGSYLDDAVRGEQVDGHPLAVRRLIRTDAVDHCQIVFLSEPESPHLTEMLQQIKSDPVLTVSDIKNFARLGGMVGFYVQDSRVHLQINPEIAKSAGLTISSKLLRIAEIISSSTGTPP